MELSYLQLLVAIVLGKVIFDSVIAPAAPEITVSKATALQYRTPPALKGAINAGTLQGTHGFNSKVFRNVLY